MRRILIFALILGFLALAHPVQVRAGHESANCSGLTEVAWGEARTQSYVLLYPAGDGRLGQALSVLPEALTQNTLVFLPRSRPPSICPSPCEFIQPKIIITV
jgi:hypothetical protein